MFDSQRESGGYSEVMDYYMSEKFGIDWKEQDHLRMRTFIEIMSLKGERDQRNNDKQYGRK